MYCMMSTTKEQINLGILSEEDAWCLFEKTLGDIKESAALQSKARKIVRKCAGLPLLIVTVATALKNKPLWYWENTVGHLSALDDGKIEKEVYAPLKLSYDLLDGDEGKSFFLLCGLLGKSDILIQDLLKYGMGLHLFEGMDTVQCARNEI